MLLALVATLAVRLASNAEGWQQPQAVAAPSFVLRSLEGSVLESSDLAGKVVVLDFWATWCAPCVRELPDLAEFHRRLKGRSDVAFVSLNVTDDQDTLRAFVAQHRLPYPVFPGDDLLGPYQVFKFPTKLVLDLRRPGKERVRLRREASTSLESLEAAMAEVLAAPP